MLRAVRKASLPWEAAYFDLRRQSELAVEGQLLSVFADLRRWVYLQEPNEALAKVVGVAAAAQLAILPVGGTPQAFEKGSKSSTEADTLPVHISSSDYLLVFMCRTQGSQSIKSRSFAVRSNPGCSIPLAGAAYAGVPQYEIAIGENLQQQAEKSDKKTSDLPTFPDIGKALNSQFGQSNPQDVGKAVDKATPGITTTIVQESSIVIYCALR